VRRPPRDGDLTALMKARSASVALAVAGDSSRLDDLVQHMDGEPAQVANLNYWAHWIGELEGEQADDSFMLSTDTYAWSGDRLLVHLTERLNPLSPLDPVCSGGVLLFALRSVRHWIGSRPRMA
jgi:hypothetical protein